ncbi:LacI family DNA-binding transcriptional regulator [Nesterenkonia halobia]|uniref:LacI family DNA-binding transcriptional regulator n=1 Tax=Nesterenkonia halobia TaxID=37922 RepID=A0ABP6RCS8_9MICC
MNRDTRRRITAAEVAERSGASRSAVSLVLNGRADGNVAPSLQERIRAAVDELGYVPQSVGRSLRSRSTRTVGVITDEIVTSPFAGGIISGAGVVAREHGFMIMVADTEGEEDLVREMSEVFFSRSVDALMLATGGLVDVAPPQELLALPAVLANCLGPADGAPSVVADEAGGSVQAVEHLLALGHRDIVQLAGTEDSPATARRRAGFLRTAEGRAAPWTIPCGWEIDEGYRAAAALFDDGDPDGRPTAILASNDRTAVGVLLAAAHRGIRVPEELSVVGVDDQAHVASCVVPALTSVALPHRGIGARAMEILLHQVPGVAVEAGAAGPPAPGDVGAAELISTELMVRDSTAAAPTR